jgi:hypothetical protein
VTPSDNPASFTSQDGRATTIIAHQELFVMRKLINLDGTSAGCAATSNNPSAHWYGGDENPHACDGFHLPTDCKKLLHCYPKRGHHYSKSREHGNL